METPADPATVDDTVDGMEPSVREQVEDIVARYGATHARAFPELRASGAVDLGLVRLGARKHPNPSIRWKCLTLLDHLDGDDSVPVFLDALAHDPVPRVRRHALHALACERCKAAPLCADVVPAIAACAEHDPNEKVRVMATELLWGHLSDPRAARVLERLARSDAHAA